MPWRMGFCRTLFRGWLTSIAALAPRVMIFTSHFHRHTPLQPPHTSCRGRFGPAHVIPSHPPAAAACVRFAPRPLLLSAVLLLCMCMNTDVHLHPLGCKYFVSWLHVHTFTLPEHGPLLVLGLLCAGGGGGGYGSRCTRVGAEDERCQGGQDRGGKGRKNCGESIPPPPLLVVPLCMYSIGLWQYTWRDLSYVEMRRERPFAVTHSGSDTP